MFENYLFSLAGLSTFTFGVVIMIAWSLAWKGVALWKAARSGDRNWFIALLVLNTAGILEIIYIFVFNKKNLPAVTTQPPQQ